MEIQEMKVIRDGANWVFVLPDFENLQVSPQVWTDDGDTDIDAIYEQLINQQDEIKNRTKVNAFIYKISHSYDSVNETEKDKMIDDATDLLALGTTTKDQTKNIVSALVSRFIAGYNDYKSIDEFLHRLMEDEWESACQTVFAGNNSGWAMCVKQLLDDLRK